MARCTEIIAPGLVDSPLKLQLTLLFVRHPQLSGDMWSLSEWLRESPWSVEEALEALADTGVLGRERANRFATYRLAPCPEYATALRELAGSFDDPLRRDQIYALVRAANQERMFRKLQAEPHYAGFVV